MSNKKGLPSEISNYWPEIFKDIEIKAIPIDYIRSINIVFSDGTVWTVDIDRNKESIDVNDIEEIIEEIIDENEDSIETVDFKLDTEQVQKDIKKRTDIFMKKRR